MQYQIGQVVEQRTAFGDALVELALEYPELIVLDPDVATSTKTAAFGEKFPGRFFETGIAEQNTVGIAAGLSTMGYIPFVSAFAVFLTHRSGDQIRNSVAHPCANVKLNGTYAGLPTGAAGATHSSFEDIAVIRALPNMTIFEPADATEVWLLTKLALEINGPVYLRTVRCGVPVIFDKTHTLQLGKAVWLRQGTDVSIISSGMMTPRVRHVVETLSERGIDANHIHMPCLKPLDMAAIQRAAKTGLIVTVENHSVIGGLGSAVAEVTAAECPCIVRRIGFQDIFLESGNDEVLFDKYGLSETKILNAIIDVLQLRKLLP